ncbi:MAG: DUF1778 domain-containing protein [Actinomycetota bacterium]|nr:DUF1778 domain-containing protein [Actinomycetota bacterium]
MSATARIELRVDPDVKSRIEQAATFGETSISSFVLTAAQERADEVIRQHTVVPADFFDALIAELDEPATVNDAVTRAVQRSRARATKY